MSGHLHGNPETQQRDTQIRETLEGLGYDVFALPCTALDDADRMRTFLTRVARKLLTREELDLWRMRD